jgi:uncharacterized protein YndB with AHSA1/START domain|tara:strand:- start:3266 stop:3826 length:561 start_codon:yes stop_codon:yes gene_type:complete
MRHDVAFFLIVVSASCMSFAGDKEIKISIDVPADIQTVWRAWSSEQGVKTFFAPSANVDSSAGGLYEILFFPDEAKGLRGAEGTRLIAVEPPNRLVFTWNNPPIYPRIRWQYAVVEVRLVEIEVNRTRVQLTHSLFGDGADWEGAYEYFSGAWPIVFKRLVQSFENGPVDWRNLARGPRHRQVLGP